MAACAGILAGIGKLFDIHCPTCAPSITTAGDVSITGNVSAQQFIGDGSLLTGNGQGDRIVSGTTNIIATQNRSVTISAAGTQRVGIGENGWECRGWGQHRRSTIWILAGSTLVQKQSVSDRTHNAVIKLMEASDASGFTIQHDGTTTNSFQIIRHNNDSTGAVSLNIERTNGNIDIATNIPSTTLHVSGSIGIAGTGAEACDANMVGAFRLKLATSLVELCR